MSALLVGRPGASYVCTCSKKSQSAPVDSHVLRETLTRTNIAYVLASCRCVAHRFSDMRTLTFQTKQKAIVIQLDWTRLHPSPNSIAQYSFRSLRRRSSRPDTD